MDLAGIEHSIENPEYAKIFSQNARFAGVMDISGQANLLQLRKLVAGNIGTTVEKLQKIMVPVETVYAITDHTWCRWGMLGYAIRPSKVKAGGDARGIATARARGRALSIRRPGRPVLESRPVDGTMLVTMAATS